MSFAKRVYNRASRAAKTLAETAFSDPVVILMYHRVNEPGGDLNNLTVSEESFREQMRVIREKFEPVSLRDPGGHPSWRNKLLSSGRRKVAVTFDDGYADTFQKALPIMQEFEIPSSVYVTTGMVGEKREFWWDEMQELLVKRLPAEQMPEIRSAFDKVAPGTLEDGAERDRFYSELTRVLKRTGERAIDITLDELRRATGSGALARDPHLAMTMEELLELGRSELVEIGSHTVSHPSLASLDRDRQVEEMRESKKFLERVLDREITSIAYPYGDAVDFNETTIEVAETLGYRHALSTVLGVATPFSPRYALPRMFVKNWDAQEFEKKLQRFFWIA